MSVLLVKQKIGVIKLDYPFMWCQNFSCMFFLHKARVLRTDGQRDGRMDRQNNNLQESASIAASRVKLK